MNIPPGQVATRQLWQVGETEPAHDGNVATWKVLVNGAVKQPMEMTATALLAMPSEQMVMDVHCVTGWSRPATQFVGVPASRLIQQASPHADAAFVRFEAYSVRKHDTSLPLEVALKDCWVIHQVDGQPLTRDRGGPLRIVTRGKYFYKSLKWLHRIELLTADSPGYWERESGYHNNADPWREERFDHAYVATREQIASFRELQNFDGYRSNLGGKVLIKANLSGWRPRSRDLRGVQLKACNFDGADLAGVDLSGANLTLSNFFRADLTDADLTNADLEGAQFAGAQLQGAKFLDVHLSATKFFKPLQNGKWKGPRSVSGMQFRAAPGSALVEQQQDLLEKALNVVK